MSDDDVATLDDFVRRTGLPSRSAGLQRAVQMLRHPDLEDDYVQAWADWSTEPGSVAWDGTAGDGIPDAAR